MTFTDFLTLLQKEAFFRECLSDAQMYKLSARRIVFEKQCELVTRQQLEILKQIKKQSSVGEGQQSGKMPSFSYLIEHMKLFEYQGVTHLMVAFENKSVQVFDFESGLSIFEFNFDEQKRHPAEPKAAQEKPAERPKSQVQASENQMKRTKSLSNQLQVLTQEQTRPQTTRN